MISHEHRTVFVHVPKAAGQSVELAFLRDLGLSWADKDPLLLRKNDNQRLGPPRLAHLTAEEYVRHHWISRSLFESYFTFAFVRDPVSRAVSMYRYMADVETVTFAEFVRKRLADRMWRTRYWWVRPQSEYLFSSDGRQLVDFIGRYESLQDDFTTVAERTGLRSSTLPYRNASSGQVRGEVATDPDVVSRLHSLYERDFALLGYAPSGRST